MNKHQTDYLNKLVGTYGVLYIKLHQHHWYVTGPNFFALHAKFEALYDEVTANLDEVAERMLQLEAKPASTLKEFLELSLVKEAPFSGKANATEMVKSIIADFETLDKTYQEGFELFIEDQGTTDMLVGLQKAVQKHLWMLKAVLA